MSRQARFRSAMWTVLATLFGLGFALLPFARYSAVGGLGAAHADHAPRHGGVLRMAGDVHIELVRGENVVEVFVSDAQRRPLRPASVEVAGVSGEPSALVWREYRMVALSAATKPGNELTVTVVLADGTRTAALF